MKKHYRPSITYKGFKNSVKDYEDHAVVEELVANSYDADASTAVVLLNATANELYVFDDGEGFDEEKIRIAATLGGGDKEQRPYSNKKRSFLGSYGVGLKSSLNIASAVKISSRSKQGYFSTNIDWNELEKILTNKEHKGFEYEQDKAQKSKYSGTCIRMILNKPTDKSHLNKYGKALSNLPTDKGKFLCYYGLYEEVASSLENFDKDFKSLSSIAKKLQEQGLLSLASNSREKELINCTIKKSSSGKSDDPFSAIIYFAGMDPKTYKVYSLKKSLRGIYVRIHGRLLKHDFSGRGITYNISRYMKFANGIRVEIEINWLRDQITLSRDGLTFSNEKLENDFVKLVQSVLSKFIAPKLKQIEQKKAKVAKNASDNRRTRVEQRIAGDKAVILQGFKNGFKYIPETDAELAVLLAAQPKIIKDAGGWDLVDYNEQGSFDCMFYCRNKAEIINVELEPTLTDFLNHNNKQGIELIVTWKKGNWKVGSKKTGKPGCLELQNDKDKKPGFYKLLEFSSDKSKTPRKVYNLLIVQEFLSSNKT